MEHIIILETEEMVYNLLLQVRLIITLVVAEAELGEQTRVMELVV